MYKRHYLDNADDLGAGMMDFDVITEQQFTDRAAFGAWVKALTTRSAGDRIASDEARFLDRSRTRVCAVFEANGGTAHLGM